MAVSCAAAATAFVARVAGSTVASNADALRAFLTTARSSTSNEPTDPHHDHTVATLDVTGARAGDVLQHVTALYNAAARVDPGTGLTLLLRARADAQALHLEPLRTSHLTSELGYDLDDYVAMGGTFDRLHVGHKVLLTTSVLHARHRLRVGVTGEPLLVKKKHRDVLQPFEERRGAVERFVRQLRSDLEYEVVELSEPTGGTVDIEAVRAMVVSPETLPAVESINAARAAKHFAPLKPIVIEYIGPDDTEEGRVSSTSLRERHKRRQTDETKEEKDGASAT